MQIELRYLSEKDKKEICVWKYDGKYAMYNLSDHEQMRREQCGFFNPEKEEEYCGTWEDGEFKMQDFVQKERNLRCQHQQGKECFTGWSEDTEAFFMGVRVLVVSNNVF